MPRDVWVERDGSNNIIAVYGRPNPGVADEKLAHDHPDLLAYRAAQDDRAAKIATFGEKQDALLSMIVDNFDFILEIFQVGKDKGLWVNSDFDPVLVAKGQDMKQAVNEWRTAQANLP